MYRIDELTGLEDLFQVCKSLMEKKNGDYNASWRRMRFEGISDVIANKIDRIRSLEDLARQGKDPAVVDESIEDNLQDIVNYVNFYRIKRHEQSGAKLPSQLPELKLDLASDLTRQLTSQIQESLLVDSH